MKQARFGLANSWHSLCINKGMDSFFIRGLLILSLVLPGPQFVSANPEDKPRPITPTEKYAFLMALGDRVESAVKANRALLSVVKSCYTTTPLNAAECVKYRANNAQEISIEFNLFHRMVFNWNLLKKTRDFIEAFYDQNGEADPVFVRIKEWEHPLNKVESLSKVPVYNYSLAQIQDYLSPEHALPITRPKVNEDGERYDEISGSPATITGYLSMLCGEYHQWNKEHGLRTYPFRALEMNPVCQKFDVQYSIKDRGFYFPEVGRLTREEKLFFSQLKWWMLDRTSSPGEAFVLTKELEDFYFMNASIRPYVALVNSPTPSNAELYAVFSELLKNAEAEIVVVNEKRKEMTKQMALMPLKREAVQKGHLSRAELDMASMFYFMDSVHQVTQVVESPNQQMELFPDTNWNHVADELQREYGRRQMWKVGGEVGAAILGTMVCYVPVGWAFRGVRAGIKVVGSGIKTVRGIKAARKTARDYRMAERAVLSAANRDRVVADLLCVYGIFGVGTNWYFYEQAQDLHQDTYRRVFSTIDGQNLLADLRALPAAEENLMLQVIMFPVGTFSLKGLGRIVSKLSGRSQAVLQRLATP